MRIVGNAKEIECPHVVWFVRRNFIYMYISKDELKARLSGQLKIESSKAGGAKKNLSHEERVLIAALAKVDSQENVAHEFKVSQPMVSNLSRGLTDGIHLDPSLVKDSSSVSNAARDSSQPKGAIGTVTKDGIASEALDTLMDALGIVKSNMSKATKPLDASAIAKNMAVIVDRMNPPKKEEQRNTNVFIQINAPKQKQESDFEFIEVEANP